jgi:hypothetical protein
MNVFHFSCIFQFLIFGWRKVTSVKKNINIVGHGNPSVLWHSMENRMNFVRHITIIKSLSLCKLKPEHCSQPYSARHVFRAINCCREQEDL